MLHHSICIRFNVYSSVSCEVCATSLKRLHCHHDNLYLQITKVLDTVLKARSHHLLHSHCWQLTAFVPALKMKRSMGMFKAASDTPFCRFSSAISKPLWMVARSAHCLNLILWYSCFLIRQTLFKDFQSRSLASLSASSQPQVLCLGRQEMVYNNTKVWFCSDTCICQIQIHLIWENTKNPMHPQRRWPSCYTCFCWHFRRAYRPSIKDENEQKFIFEASVVCRSSSICKPNQLMMLPMELKLETSFRGFRNCSRLVKKTNCYPENHPWITVCKPILTHHKFLFCNNRSLIFHISGDWCLT